MTSPIHFSSLRAASLRGSGLQFIWAILLLFLVSLVTDARGQERVAYRDPALPIDERVENLLSRMTPEEKFWQLFMIPAGDDEPMDRYDRGIFGFQFATRGAGADAANQMLEGAKDAPGDSAATTAARRINAAQRHFVENTRLGIPIIPFDEALHGLVRPGATAFPQAIGLAATFDTSLVGDVADAIAGETRSRGIRQILSPVLNIARDVRWGRVEETYGEDPFLTSAMGAAFVGAVERAGIVATPKHFVANVGDGGRDSYPIQFSKRLLEEVYFPAFQTAIQQAGARSIMAAYNSVHGAPTSASRYLLTDRLNAWGFNGYVISDAGGTGGANVLHYTASDYADATKKALEAGLDVIFQTSHDHFPLFWKAVETGMVDMDAVDRAVRRVLRVKFELGLFEDPYVDPGEATRWNGHPDHRALARRAAAESMVLLKNDGNVLPLDPDAHIAVIGPDAVDARLGGYSGPGRDVISMLDGVRARSSSVRFAPGVPRSHKEVTPIPTTALQTPDGKPGLAATYWANPSLEGDPAVTRTDARVDFGWTLYGPDPALPFDWYSVRWTGRLIAPETGTFQLGIEGNDGYRLWLDESLLIDRWTRQTARRTLVPVTLEKGRAYDLRIEFHESTGNARIRLVWDAGIPDDSAERIAEAVQLAQGSDVTVIAAGIEEGEFGDRASLRLPGMQEHLIREVAATGTPVVVVLFGGSAITMSEWIDTVPGLLEAWYPGEAGGNALADVLFGDESPGGRLPITFPVSEGQLPLYYNHKPTGRGDDYRDLTGRPLFPFGFGLTYTSFAYSDLEITPTVIEASERTSIRFTLTNTGSRSGSEVVQLYLRDELASVAQPVMALKGFQRIQLDPGESRRVAFELGPNELSMLDADLVKLVEPGRFRVMIGASSFDIRLRGFLDVR